MFLGATVLHSWHQFFHSKKCQEYHLGPLWYIWCETKHHKNHSISIGYHQDATCTLDTHYYYQIDSEDVRMSRLQPLTVLFIRDIVTFLVPFLKQLATGNSSLTGGLFHLAEKFWGRSLISPGLIGNIPVFLNPVMIFKAVKLWGHVSDTNEAITSDVITLTK